MNAVEVLHAAHAAGVRVGVVGASLELDAERAPPDELLEEIRRFKPEILALLSDPAPEFSRVLKAHKVDLMSALSAEEDVDWNDHPDFPPAELAEVAKAHGLTLTELEKAAGSDWLEVKADPKLAHAFANAIQTRRMRERGQVPSNYTSVTVCAGCGPVPIWVGAPEHVLACPWCFNRLAGRSIP